MLRLNTLGDSKCLIYSNVKLQSDLLILKFMKSMQLILNVCKLGRLRDCQIT